MSIGDVIGVPGAGGRSTAPGDTFKCACCGHSFPMGIVHQCSQRLTSGAPGLTANGTATIDVCDVERLMKQRDKARAERDRARELAARLEQIIAGDRVLLWRTLEDHPSNVAEEQLGFDIAAWLQDTRAV